MLTDQVVALSGDDLRDIWVPQQKVGIRSHSNAALAGIQVEDLGSVCASHCHKLILIHLASHLSRHNKLKETHWYLNINQGFTESFAPKYFMVVALDCMKSGSYEAHHTFVPDKRHPLLSAIGALWDLGEVIFSYGSLRGQEGAVSTSSDLQVPTR